MLADRPKTLQMLADRTKTLLKLVVALVIICFGLLGALLWTCKCTISFILHS